MAAQPSSLNVALMWGCGIALGLFVASEIAISFGYVSLARVLVWPSPLAQALVPPPNIGTVALPIYRETPLHIAAWYVGVAATFPLYIGGIYAMLAFRKSRAWAAAITNRAIRAGLIGAGLLLTLPLGAFALFGVVGAGLNANLESTVFATGCLAGVAAAWTRILISPLRIKSSPGIFWAISIGLFVGVVVDAWMVVDYRNGLLSWFAVPGLVVGLFLIGATIGEIHSAP